MIEAYLNQTAIWHQVTGKNAHAEPIFADPVNIKVRWEGKRRLVRNKDGHEIVSEARVFCLEAIKPEDLIEYDDRKWPVITASPIPGLDGEVSHREVAV